MLYEVQGQTFSLSCQFIQANELAGSCMKLEDVYLKEQRIFCSFKVVSSGSGLHIQVQWLLSSQFEFSRNLFYHIWDAYCSFEFCLHDLQCSVFWL